MPLNLTFSDLPPACISAAAEAPAGRPHPSPPRPAAGGIAPRLATMPRDGLSAETRMRLLAFQIIATNGEDWDGFADTGQQVGARIVNGALVTAICAVVIGALWYVRGVL